MFEKAKAAFSKGTGGGAKHFLSGCFKMGNREAVPDVSILLPLPDILETTTDKLLSGGSIIIRKSKRINDLKEGFHSLENLKYLFGETSTFYRGAMDGINRRINIDIEAYLKNDYSRECLLAEATIQYLSCGYWIDERDIEENFKSEKMKSAIRNYIKKQM